VLQVLDLVFEGGDAVEGFGLAIYRVSVGSWVAVGWSRGAGVWAGLQEKEHGFAGDVGETTGSDFVTTAFEAFKFFVREPDADHPGASCDGHGFCLRAVFLESGFDVEAVDFGGDGALEQLEGDDEPVFLLHLEEHPFEAFEGTATDADALAFVHEGVGSEAEAGGADAADGVHFGFEDGLGFGAVADDVDDARGAEDGVDALDIDAAEDVADEEGGLDLANPVAPLAAVAVERDVFLIVVGA